LVANAAGVPGTERSRIVETGGIKVGLFGLVDPEGIQVAGVTVEDPVAAAQREAQALRGKGAELVVALAHLKRPAARKVAHAIGEGIVIAGDEVGDDGGAPEQVGGAIVIAPADQAQRAARIELTVAGAPSLQLVESPAQRAQALAKAKDKLAQARALIEKLAKDPKADPDFLATQRALAAKLDGERAALEQPQAAPPASYAVAELVPIKRRLARDPKVQQAMKELDRAVGEANRKAGEAHPVPPPGKGEPRYVGIEECELCHQPAVDFWKKTVHARAWQELVAVDKQWSFDCIGCHVTGYGQPGGSAVAHVDKLTDVQCEVCHGPASLHAAKPKKVHLAMPDEGRCKDCHTKDHSDTFQFTAYLRDVLGPGHGAKRREKLGDGPTGQALRKAALEKAKGE
jgi:hypothetical protein